MALGWNEIKDRAVKFSKEWERAFNEEADAQSFLVEFFNVFGISSRKVSTFEHKVKKLDEHSGYIDLFWKGTILIEMKSRGKNLDRAYQQSKDYLDGIKQHELPKYILVSDFENFHLYDIDENTETDFQLKDFVHHVQLFGFIAGYQKRIYKAEDPVNIEAAYLMGKLHDALKEGGYTGHELEKYLVRLLFCLFSEDTTIFEKHAFYEYIVNKTNEDGSDLGNQIAHLFQILNTPDDKRQKNLDESLAIFPYVNGQLFAEQLSFASFNSKMRQTLLECCQLDWSKISPAIFGSMFQSVMDTTQRRNLGAHYTSEKNILKLIKPLFLDKLWSEFEAVKSNTGKLKAFHNKIASLRFLDPACGCGNFLVITYRELRLLELAILKKQQNGQQVLDLESLMLCNVERFYGIEYEEFPAQIAQVALWLMDHQMNMLISQEFGEYFVRLPLRQSAKIVHGNALRIDWDSLLVAEKTISIYAKEANIIQIHEHDITYGKVNVFAEKINITDKPEVETSQGIKFDYILGNPPFIGHQWRNEQQMADMQLVFGDAKRAGRLDYVAAWYVKAAHYLEQHNSLESIQTDLFTSVAFVSTNSIAQGEQVGILWNELFNRYKIKIHFAHRTFKWGNEAKSSAAVHVVIIGFSNFDIPEKLLYEYEDIKGEPHELKVKNINPYLTEGKDITIDSRNNPIHSFPSMFKGSQPTDGGFLILSKDEREQLIKADSTIEQWIRPFIGGEELINGSIRYCLWLKDCPQDTLRRLHVIKERLENVSKARLKSATQSVRVFARFPYLFTQDRQPVSNYLAIPRVSSENRIYIPMAFLSPDIIAHEKLIILPNANLFIFGVLTSMMHMVWTKYVSGRLESRISYSPAVYNNFSWPENPSDKQKETIEKAAQKVLDARSGFPDSSLADLYDPLYMPPALVKAHNDLDKAVDLAYRTQPFLTETKRIEFLFELYDTYTAGLFAGKKAKKSVF